MKALFVGRNDYPVKKGGDGVQIEAYKIILLQNGHEVFFYNEIKDIDEIDVVHFFNIDRIYDLLEVRRKFAKGNKIFILHSIHQNYEYLKNIKKIVKNYTQISITIPENVKFIIRSIKAGIFNLSMLRYLFLKKNEGIIKLIDEIDYFHFLSDTECSWFEKDYNIKINMPASFQK